MKLVVLLLVALVSAISSNISSGEFISRYDPLDARGFLYQESYPTYKDGILTIPRVDISERVGMFQDAQFTFINGVWQLVDFKTAETDPLFRPQVSSVETIITDYFPVQVYLKIIGRFHQGDPIDDPLIITPQRLIGNTFEITIHETKVPPIGMDDGSPFQIIIPLNVYGLRAGVYQYVLNGSEALNTCTMPSYPCDGNHFYVPTTFKGTFELKKDNRF